MNNFFEHWKMEFMLPLENPVLVFSVILLIILLAPILLRKIKIPGIIGLIISGIIFGPHGFHLLEKNSAVELFSTIGLLYIMFIAGLELDLNEFIKNRHKSIVFGFFTFIIPMGIGFPVCYYLLQLDMNASILTASMFSTHTLVAYPIVSKLGVSKNQAVAITVGGTILTDTAVLILLAVVMGTHQGGLSSDFWIQLISSLIIFAGIMFFIIPRITRWFFKTLESEKHSHYIFVLAVVFFAAFLAEVAGVEPIIGAFVAGLALNRLIPHTSALMNRIEFMGNALFIPFFLISVGMVVDTSVIFSGWGALIIAGSLTIVALIGKWLAAFLTQISFGYTSVQRKLIFGLSSSHAAATLAVILVGYKAEILDENILNGTIVLILITCIVASFSTEKASKALAMEKGDDDIVPDKQKNNEHIIIPISKSSNIENLVDFAALIKNPSSLQPITLLTVIPNDGDTEKNILKAKRDIESVYSHASASETKINFITTIDHNISGGIIRTSKETMADLVLLGWPKSTPLINKIVGENEDNVILNLDKTIFVSQIVRPLNTMKRIVLIVPPLSELEAGFSFWMEKVSRLFHQISLPLVFYCNSATAEFIKKFAKKHELTKSMIIKDFNDWQDFLILSRYIIADDLLIIVSARRYSLSWTNVLDRLPPKLEKYFSLNNKVLIYPHQEIHAHLNASYKDINSEALESSIETIQKIGKGIGRMFKKDTPEEK